MNRHFPRAVPAVSGRRCPDAGLEPLAPGGRFVAAGMPVAALSPLELARWVGEKIA
ncbi:hypothetical protein ACFW3D_06435 [Streptomyces sp. NPDC058864]